MQLHILKSFLMDLQSQLLVLSNETSALTRGSSFGGLVVLTIIQIFYKNYTNANTHITYKTQLYIALCFLLLQLVLKRINNFKMNHLFDTIWNTYPLIYLFIYCVCVCICFCFCMLQKKKKRQLIQQQQIHKLRTFLSMLIIIQLRLLHLIKRRYSLLILHSNTYICSLLLLLLFFFFLVHIIIY